jgi:predicted double-glycine peptidase
MMLRLAALLAALSGGFWVDVPFIKQDKNGCGPASVWMVMQYWQKSSPPFSEIHQALYSAEAEGVWATDMERYFRDHGFTTFAFSGEWQDLVENLSKGRPIIVSLGASRRGAPLHYVVVAGIQEQQQTVLVNDPAERKLWPMSRAEFEERWSAMARWSLLALPSAESVETKAIVSAVASETSPPVTPELREASTAFRVGDYITAGRMARLALRHDPMDPSANELLATVYFLQDNVEAALKYWNRVDAPQIRDIVVEPSRQWDTTRIERTLPLSRASVLRLSDYTLAQKRLEATGDFSRFTFELKPTEGQDFDLTLHTADRGGFHWLSWLRGLPYETVAPQFTNVGGRGINVESMARWDSNKRRAFLSMSVPSRNDLRYHVGLDFRDENWDWNGSRFRLWREELQASVSRVATDKLSWSSGGVVSRRNTGWSLKYDGGLGYDIWTVPEKRLTVKSELRGDVGKILSADRRFAHVEPGLSIHWLPQTRGNDYETTIRVRAGRVFGDPTFDELFSVGLDRDSDLWMRAHPAVHDGLKGAGLIGRRYFLWNSEIAKTVWRAPFTEVKLAPFVDVARVGDWYLDTGAEVRVSVASIVTVSLSVGRDMKAGRTVLFTDLR